MKANLLEKAIMVLSPKTAYNRAMYQMAARNYYTAADTGSRREGWTTVNATGEKTNEHDRDIIRARARDLERNSDMLPAQVLALERNVVGTGIMLQAKIKRNGGDETDEALNTLIEDAWRDWCKPEHCDITARMSFDEIQEMCVRRRFVDGGILVIKVYENGQFKLQLKEVDCLDTSILAFEKNRVVGGIELNEYDKAVAYHIKQSSDFAIMPSVRVPANRVCYLSYLTRPSQIREMTPAAPSLPRIDDTNELITSAVMKERLLSYFGLLLSNTGAGIGGFGRGIGESSDPKKAYPEEVLEQGMIKRLAPGEVPHVINPSGVSSTAGDMARLTQRLSGGAVGLSYEASSRDMSQVNYSSARQGLLEDQRTYRRWQQNLITHLCTNVYLEWLDWAVLKGQISLPDYYQDKASYQKHIWISSGWEWIDPLKESKANTEALHSGQKTLQDICSANGKDWRDVIKQRGLELELQKQYGLSLDVQSAPATSEPGEVSPAPEDTPLILNGAQIDSLVSIVQLTASGQISYDSAIKILTSAYPFDEETAAQILNDGKITKQGEDENATKTKA